MRTLDLLLVAANARREDDMADDHMHRSYEPSLPRALAAQWDAYKRQGRVVHDREWFYFDQANLYSIDGDYMRDDELVMLLKTDLAMRANFLCAYRRVMVVSSARYSIKQLWAKVFNNFAGLYDLDLTFIHEEYLATCTTKNETPVSLALSDRSERGEDSANESHTTTETGVQNDRDTGTMTSSDVQVILKAITETIKESIKKEVEAATDKSSLLNAKTTSTADAPGLHNDQGGAKKTVQKVKDSLDAVATTFSKISGELQEQIKLREELKRDHIKELAQIPKLKDENNRYRTLERQMQALWASPAQDSSTISDSDNTTRVNKRSRLQ